MDGTPSRTQSPTRLTGLKGQATGHENRTWVADPFDVGDQ